MEKVCPDEISIGYEYNLLNTSDLIPSTKFFQKRFSELFSLDHIQLTWKAKRKVNAGLWNIGNSCYINATVQALLHIPAFANWIEFYEDNCEVTGKCPYVSIYFTFARLKSIPKFHLFIYTNELNKITSHFYINSNRKLKQNQILTFSRTYQSIYGLIDIS